MRGYYLTTRSESGCRGGVGYSYKSDYGGEEYELEIGHQCNASPQMIAMCVLHDEFLEILRFKDSSCGALSGMVLSKYHKLVNEIEDNLRREHDEERLNNTD